MNKQGEWTFIDIVSLISFVVGLQNLELNITQENLDNQTIELKEQVDKEVKAALTEIHEHLERQDKKINKIIDLLEEKYG